MPQDTRDAEADTEDRTRNQRKPTAGTDEVGRASQPGRRDQPDRSERRDASAAAVRSEEQGVGDPGRVPAAEARATGRSRPPGELGGHTVQPWEQEPRHPAKPDSSSKEVKPPQPREEEAKAAELARKDAPADDRTRTGPIPSATDKKDGPTARPNPPQPKTLLRTEAKASTPAAAPGNAAATPAQAVPANPVAPRDVAKPTGTGPAGNAPNVDAQDLAHRAGYDAATPPAPVAPRATSPKGEAKPTPTPKPAASPSSKAPLPPASDRAGAARDRDASTPPPTPTPGVAKGALPSASAKAPGLQRGPRPAAQGKPPAMTAAARPELSPMERRIVDAVTQNLADLLVRAMHTSIIEAVQRAMQANPGPDQRDGSTPQIPQRKP